MNGHTFIGSRQFQQADGVTVCSKECHAFAERFHRYRDVTSIVPQVQYITVLMYQTLLGMPAVVLAGANVPDNTQMRQYIKEQQLTYAVRQMLG